MTDHREGGERLKLTKPQAALLAELPTSVSDGYPPALHLVALGLARWERGAYGSSTLVPTPLKDQDQ